jgi:hypothetical protein
MRIKVNGTTYEISYLGEKAYVNHKEVFFRLNEDTIIIDGKIINVDFFDDCEPSLLIINGLAYITSKISTGGKLVKEIKIPISGKIMNIFVTAGTEVKEGSVLASVQAMKMENQIKSPRSGKIREIKVSNYQSVKAGDILITFE